MEKDKKEKYINYKQPEYSETISKDVKLLCFKTIVQSQSDFGQYLKFNHP